MKPASKVAARRTARRSRRRAVRAFARHRATRAAISGVGLSLYALAGGDAAANVSLGYGTDFTISTSDDFLVEYDGPVGIQQWLSPVNPTADGGGFRIPYVGQGGQLWLLSGDLFGENTTLENAVGPGTITDVGFNLFDLNTIETVEVTRSNPLADVTIVERYALTSTSSTNATLTSSLTVTNGSTSLLDFGVSFYGDLDVDERVDGDDAGFVSNGQLIQNGQTFGSLITSLATTNGLSDFTQGFVPGGLSFDTLDDGETVSLSPTFPAGPDDLALFFDFDSVQLSNSAQQTFTITQNLVREEIVFPDPCLLYTSPSPRDS